MQSADKDVTSIAMKNAKNMPQRVFLAKVLDIVPMTVLLCGQYFYRYSSLTSLAARRISWAIFSKSLRRAEYVGPEPELKGKQGVLRFHVFKAKRKIFGKEYDFIIKVHEMKDGKYFYDSYTKKQSHS